MVFLLMVGLVGPLGVAGPLGSQAASEEASPEQAAAEEEGEGLPFWTMLRSVGEEQGEPVRFWTTEDLNAVDFPTAEVGYAVGDNGTVLKTTDRGETWQVWRLARTDPATGAEEVGHLHGVHFVSEQTGFVVGDGGVILKTFEGGESWGLVPVPAIPAEVKGVALRSVHFPTAEVGYAVGDRGVVLKTEDGGVSWKKLGISGAHDYYSVHFADKDNGVVVGGATALRTRRTEDGGKTWNDRDRGSHISRGLRGAVLLEAKGVGYAVGNGGFQTVGNIERPTEHSFSSVWRTADGFTAAPSENADTERAVRKLRGVTAYRTQTTATEVDVELLEVVHAVGFEGPLPVALTRFDKREEGQQTQARPWVAEPIEAWDAHEGLQLRAVSASPEGETVVAVGTRGLMLRRSTAPEEVVAATCLPRRLASLLKDGEGQTLLPDQVPVCPEPEEPQAPVEMTPSVAPPPTLSVSPPRARVGQELALGGQHWRACRPTCQESEVELSLRQRVEKTPGVFEDKVFSLGKTKAKADGSFTHTAKVPSGAVLGTATLRADGAPSPDGGPSAEAKLFVMALTLSLNPAGANRGDAFVIKGAGWHACTGPGDNLTCQGSELELTFTQGKKTFELGDPGEEGKRVRLTVKAAADGTFTRTASVPEGAADGEATVRAEAVEKPEGEEQEEGDPPLPDGGTITGAPFDVFTKCRVSLKVTNPEFPCLANVELRNEQGNTVVWGQSGSGDPTVHYLYVDPGLGEPGETCDPGQSKGREVHGRAVIGIGTHVYLYDLECLRQRGAPGFGKGFSGASASGEETGVINLAHAGIEVGPNTPTPRRVVLDTERHILYVASRTLSKHPGADQTHLSISALSLTGGFPPATVNFDEEMLPGRMTNLGLDARSGMLYAATASGDGLSQFAATTTPQRDTHVHGIRPRMSEGGEFVLEHRWSLLVGDLCATTNQDELRFFGVSRGHGRHLSLPCQGTDFTQFGHPQVYPKGILTVTLPTGKEPDELTQEDAEDFTRRFEVVPGGGMGTLSRQPVRGDQAAGVLAWQTGRVLLVWDLDEAMWVGSLQIAGKGELMAGDPASGRLYLNRSLDGSSGALTLFQVANLPGSVELSKVAVGFDSLLPPGAFDPRTRRLLTASGGRPLRVLEDRIAPPIAFADPDPDERTHDIDEQEAFSVERRGATAAYGARVWWTGLTGTLPGQYDGVTSGGGLSGGGPQPPSGLTWDWLVSGGRNNPLGARLSTLPWRPHDSSREVFSARVEDASLAVQDSAFGSATGLSDATAWGLDIDGGTNADVRFRRGTREWREVGTLQVETFCDNFSLSAQQDCRKRWFGDPKNPDDKGFKEDWERFYYGNFDNDGDGKFDEDPPGDADGDGNPDDDSDGQVDEDPGEDGLNDDLRRPDECFVEAYDRAFREVDGERQVHLTDKDGKPNPCFGPFDQHDPERPGIEQLVGLTQRARCTDPGDESRASTGAATVTCDVSGGITRAGAESASSKNATGNDAFPLELPSGVTVRVDGTVTDTRSFRDPKRGMVSVAEALAQGIEVSVEGLGRLRIGQVATRAEAWATGRPGGAGSSYKVGYSDVEVQTADGEVAFSCDPHGEVSVTHPFKEKVDEAKKAADSHRKAADEGVGGVAPALAGDVGATCDPQQISAAVGRVFGGIVDMVAPARDADPRMTGTPGGVQAIVRRDRRDYWIDRVLFDVVRDELPGLQLTINADGTEFNRYRIDLAAVFAESTYYVGQPFEGLKELPATIDVSLHDLQGTPLSGGGFEVVADQDADGALGAADAAVARCTTGSDGVGDCRLSSLTPGPYLVRQLSAPPGYLAQEAPVAVYAAPGSTQTVPFTNALNSGTVEVTLVDPDGSLLPGGVFDLTHESGVSESCTTDAEGRCSHFPLPLGAYTLTQTHAPSGYEAAAAVRFELTSPGQIASIRVVNGFEGSEATVVIIEGAKLAAAKSDDDGSWWRRVARGLAEVIRRNPWQAVAFGLLGMMLVTPGYLAARRRELSIMREVT